MYEEVETHRSTDIHKHGWVGYESNVKPTEDLMVAEKLVLPQ